MGPACNYALFPQCWGKRRFLGSLLRNTVPNTSPKSAFEHLSLHSPGRISLISTYVLQVIVADGDVAKPLVEVSQTHEELPIVGIRPRLSYFEYTSERLHSLAKAEAVKILNLSIQMLPCRI